MIEGAQERANRAASEPEVIEPAVMDEGDEDAPGASDELVAALAGGAALTFEPDADDDDLLPGDRVARAEAAVAEAAEPPRRYRGRARARGPPETEVDSPA